MPVANNKRHTSQPAEQHTQQPRHTLSLIIMFFIIMLAAFIVIIISRTLTPIAVPIIFSAMLFALGFMLYTQYHENRKLTTELNKRTKSLEQSGLENLNLMTQLTETSRLKDEFLSMMSHELRTPLNAVIGFSGILLFDNSHDANTRNRIERIRDNGSRLMYIIDDILDLTRIESGDMILVPTEIKFRSLITFIIEDIGILAEEKQLEIISKVDDDLPQTVTLDETAFRKIITNLMSNAIKFTAKGSVSLTFSRAEENIIIEVSDTGIGIPTHAKPFIYDRFRQVDSSHTRDYGGIGIGLAIVRHLCEAMSGSISLKTVPGEGSTFTVTLPLVWSPATTED